MAYKANTAANTGYETAQIYARHFSKAPGMGDVYAYHAGGNPIPTGSDIIARFPFAVSGSTASDVGDLNTPANGFAAVSSAEHGYTMGGWTPNPSGTINNIQRWPFSSATTNAVDCGDISAGRTSAAGCHSHEYGYIMGGHAPPVKVNIIERFPFAVGDVADTSDVGDLVTIHSNNRGCQSRDYGYSCGGSPPVIPLTQNVIERFPFATNTTNASDVGNLVIETYSGTTHQSESHGYYCGGASGFPATYYTNINKWSFSDSSTNAVDVADLSENRTLAAGSSSIIHGFVMAGNLPTTPAITTNVDRFPFATESNAAYYNDTSVAVTAAGGYEV